MTAIAGAWLPAQELPTPTLGALNFNGCLEMCESSLLSPLECGVQCARSLDVNKRGTPVYVPFSAHQQPPQYVGWSVRSNECTTTEQTQFCPNPNSPTIIAFAERNPG